MKLSQLIKEEKRNTHFNLDIQGILASVENIDEEEISLATITREIVNILRIHAPEPILPLLCEKLIDYRYIERVYQLKFSRRICWIALEALGQLEEDGIQDPPSIKGLIKYGGILVKVAFTDSGTNLLVKLRFGFLQIKMNEHLVFQHLSDDEKIIMGCRDLLDRV
jgi:hypothetical protein